MIEAIYTLLAGLAGIAFLVMIVGLIRPELVLRWGEKRTRERVLLYYGVGAIVLGGLAKTVIIYELLTVLPMIVTLVMIVGLIRPELVLRWGEKRTRMRVFLYCGIGIFVLRSLAGTVMPDEIREEQRQARLEQERQEEQARLEREREKEQARLEKEQARLEQERQEEQARLEREREKEQARLEKEQARLEQERQEEQARLERARENLERGTRLFSIARTAYESQDYQTAIDSADEATRALKKAKSGIDEAAVLANQAQVFLDSAKAAAKKEREEARYTTKPGTLERIVEKHVLHVFGYKASRGAKEDDPLTVIRISAGYTVDVAYREGDPTFGVGFMRKGILNHANQFMQRVFTDPACSKVQVVLLRPHFVMVNKYGQTSEREIGKLQLNREVAEKINWDIVGFDRDMFERLLRTEGQLWWHDAFKK